MNWAFVELQFLCMKVPIESADGPLMPLSVVGFICGGLKKEENKYFNAENSWWGLLDIEGRVIYVV